MSSLPLDLTKQRSLGQLLSTCFGLYRKYFGVFAVIAFGVVIPIELIVNGLGAGLLFSGYDANPSLWQSAVSSLVYILVITPLITAMHVQAVVDVGQGIAPSARRALQKAGLVFLPLVGAIAIATIGVALFLLMLVIPGIYLAVRWYFVSQAVVVDGCTATEALERSGELVKGSWWQTFGYVVVFQLVTFVPILIIQLPLKALAKSSDSGLVLLIGQILTDAPILSFLALTGTLLYFNLRAGRDADAAGIATSA